MLTEAAWLWIGAAGMAIGAILLMLLMDNRTREEENHSVLHFIVPLIALASYLAMATKQGSVILPSGREFLYARFVDWALTTPILLIGLALTAFGPRTKRVGLLYGLVLTDVYMIVTGLFAGLTAEGSYLKWVWYLLSCGAFAAIYWMIWVPLRREAVVTGGENEALFKRNASILSVVWFAYPFVFLFGPEGLGTVGAALVALVYTVLDLVAKVLYGALSLASSKAKATRELAAGDVPQAVRLDVGLPHYPLPDTDRAGSIASPAVAPVRA